MKTDSITQIQVIQRSPRHYEYKVYITIIFTIHDFYNNIITIECSTYDV